MNLRRVASTASPLLIAATLAIAGGCSRASGNGDLVHRESIGAYTYWSFRMPREMGNIGEPFAYLSDRLATETRDCRLRSVAVSTAWPASLRVVEIVFRLDGCRDGKSYLATFTNSNRLLYVVAGPPTAASAGESALQMKELSVDVEGALAAAGRRAGDEMLSAMGRDTQVSLFLSQAGNAPLWEVRYDAWRDGRPLRYLVVTLDARTGQVTRTRG